MSQGKNKPDSPDLDRLNRFMNVQNSQDQIRQNNSSNSVLENSHQNLVQAQEQRAVNDSGIDQDLAFIER